MNAATPEPLHRTEEQVRDLVKTLTAGHTLPTDPMKGSLWLQLGQAVTQAYRTRAEREGMREGRAIIMAGAPGAGKSHGVDATRNALGPEKSQQHGLLEEDFITIDADDVKQILLGNPVKELEINPELLKKAREHWDKLIAEHAPHPLADGKPLLRGELATLVHPLSTATAGKVRENLTAGRFNIKIEGTLKGKEKGALLIDELRKRHYTQITIVAVDTPQQICLEGAHRRWIEPRTQGDVTARYTPPEAITSTFPQGQAASRCIDNARAAHHLASAQSRFQHVDLFIAHRTPSGAIVEHVNRDGQTHHFALGTTPPNSKTPRTRTPARLLTTRNQTPRTPGIGH